MITILSPAKALDFGKTINTSEYSVPNFQSESEKLIAKLRKTSRKKIMQLMDISSKLADLNYNRYQEWELPFTTENSKQAVAVFNGDVYNGLQASELNNKQLKFAQDHVRILSGLHGLLKPLDLIQPYRLEMGSKLKVGRKENLYEFWGDKLTKLLREELDHHKSQKLINLASSEYSKAAQLKKLGHTVITPIFKDLKGEVYKVIFLYAKKARGLMTRYIIDNNIDEPEQLKLFDYEGYSYSDKFSTDNEWVYIR